MILVTHFACCHQYKGYWRSCPLGWSYFTVMPGLNLRAGGAYAPEFTVVAIHSRIIQVSGGIDGLRDRAGLEAAIAAPLQSFGGEDLFPTDIEKIARIGFGLASNHAFIDGNKRIGAMVTQLLLKWNGYQFQLEQNELADMFIGIADGTKDETELRYWINDHIE